MALKIISNSKKAVFFDFGDTLASTKPPFLKRLAIAFGNAGIGVSDSEFQNAYLDTDYEIHKKYMQKGTITPEEYKNWFFPILCEKLSLRVDISSTRQKIRSELLGISYVRSALPGAVELLDHLKKMGFKLGIISNNDGKTEEKCEEVGIREFFDIISDSTNLGMVKPDSRLFHFTLNELNLLPTEAIYVGDLYGSDVLGGINAGLDVVWMNERMVEKLDDTEVIEVRNLNEVKKDFC